MNFKYKAHLQKLFSALPQGERINYIFQKHVTHSLPIKDTDFSEKLETVNRHFSKFKKYSPEKDPSKCKYYEFGSGYDLLIPIGISLLGFNELTCIDIRELVFPELINDTIKRIILSDEKFGADDKILNKVPMLTDSNFREILSEHFNINYIAPLDARKTGIESNSIDFILSNATMEHIPQIHLPDIMKECHRILKPGGIMSNAIDYRDHWSFFDNSISVYNYLQFNDKEWDRLNPSIMYQNRMRHKDHMKIINDCGFEVLEELPDLPDQTELNQLKELKLNDRFKDNYTTEELSIKSSMLVLRKN
ncbi:MAG: class I SAM-dependent methyltransferase [Ignavibacteriae bacterium]|nr:class I SAM-dependent methyltransferase [Ignavibacteriota bacterium]